MLMFLKPSGGFKALFGSLALALLCIALQGARADCLQGSADCQGQGNSAELADARVIVDEDEKNRRITFGGRTLAALAASLIISALANSAGVGGGALLVPLFNVVLSFSVKMSTALSQAAIASGAAGSAAYALTRRHPLNRKRPLVDFDIALMFTPLLLLGVSVGVLLNVLFPPVLLSFCLVVMLAYLTVRTIATGIRMRQVEARLQGLHQRFSSGTSGNGGGGIISAQAGNAAPDAGELEEEEGGQGGEARPLLGGGMDTSPAPDSGRGCRSGSSSASPSAAGTPRTPGSAGKPLLSGLRIVGRWRGRAAEAEGSAAAGSFGSDGFGSFEDAIGSSGSRGGLLPREVSMQCVSNLQAQQQQACSEEPGSAGNAGQTGVQDFSTTSEVDHQQQLQGQQQQQGQQHQQQGQQQQQEGQQQGQQGQPPLDRWQADGSVTVNVAQYSSLAPTALKLPFPSLASPSRSPVRPALRQQLWEQRQRQESLPGTPLDASPGGQAEQAAFNAGIHHGGPQDKLNQHRFCWLAIGQLVALWAIFLAFQLAKASLSSASWKYVALYVAQAVASVAASAVFARQVLRRQKQQLQLAQGFASGNLEQPMLAAASPANSPTSARAASSPTNLAQGVAPLPWQHQQGQQQQQPSHHHGGSSTAAAPCAGSTGGSDWTQRKILRVMGVVVAGGALAGLLGIGGGMVIGPLLLGMHVHPQVSSATSGVMVLFSASVAAVSFAAAGRLNLQYAAAFGAACFAAAFMGVLVVGGLVRRSGRASIIVLILASMIGLGGVLTAASLMESLLGLC